VDVVESCRGFLWLLLGTPDLPSGDGGVLCGGGGLLVEKMNSVDPFLFSRTIGFSFFSFSFFFRTVGFFFRSYWI
jgi:hypothetical protein